MRAPLKTAAVANWFLDRAAKDDVPLDPMKLQKLIYFAHGWYLALTNGPLIDEHPQAWNYGPVIPSIYHEFKNFGRGPITERAWALEYPTSGASDRIKKFLSAKITVPRPDSDPATEDFFEQIWKVYGGLSGVQLSNLSHVEGGAWDKAFKAAGGQRNVDIADDFIKEEFEAKRNKNRVGAN